LLITIYQSMNLCYEFLIKALTNIIIHKLSQQTTL